MKQTPRSNGFVALIVLIAVAIVLVLSAVQLRTIMAPGQTVHRDVPLQERPWLMEDLLIPDAEKIKLPNSPKPTLNEPLTLKQNVTLDENPRGTVEMTFQTDGRIEAAWSCAYAKDDQQSTITATMAGNVVTKKTYTDLDGNTDKTRLFFVAKGRYQKSTTIGQTPYAGEKGTAWLSGWLTPDETIIEAFISIHQTTDWVGVYTLKDGH